MVFSLWSAAQAAAQFFRLKWGTDPLVTSCMAGDDRQFGTADPERLSQQLHDRLVGGAIGGRFRDPNLQFFTPIGPGAPAANARLGRARRDTNGDDPAQSMCAGGPPAPT